MIFRACFIIPTTSKVPHIAHRIIQFEMQVTKYVVSQRNDALLVGDYGTYKRQLARRLLTLRRKLGRATPKGRKYTEKAPISAADVSSNPEYARPLGNGSRED